MWLQPLSHDNEQMQLKSIQQFSKYHVWTEKHGETNSIFVAFSWESVYDFLWEWLQL
jgi:hypothetical protein